MQRLLLAEGSRLRIPASPSPLPPASPPGLNGRHPAPVLGLPVLRAWRTPAWPTGLFSSAVAHLAGGLGSGPGLSAQPALPVPLPVGAIRPACPLGGTARASCRYALVPEPKIAGDARLPWRGSGDVTRRQSPAAPRSGAEEWERASPSIPPGAGGGRVVPGKKGGPLP